MQELASKKSISSQEFDESSARLKSAQAAYDMACSKRRQLDSKLAEVEQEIRGARIMRQYSRISAPFSGVVTAKSVEPGNLAAPGDVYKRQFFDRRIHRHGRPNSRVTT